MGVFAEALWGQGNGFQVRKEFSSHWKKVFQSLENPGCGAELPDCAKPKEGRGFPVTFPGRSV
jgi:hypothetical protein